MKIKFIPQNIEVDVNPNKSVLNIALENGIQIYSICKGIPSCAECRIKIAEGESNVNKPSKAELSLIGSSYYIDGRRLSCQVRCFGPVTIDTSEQLNRQDNPSKKLRGFKSEKQYESHAIMDTMILTEPPKETGSVSEESRETKPQQREHHRPQNQQRQQQGQNQGDKQNQGQRGGRQNQQRSQKNGQPNNKRGQQDQ
jgi:ferredoxin